MEICGGCILILDTCPGKIGLEGWLSLRTVGRQVIMSRDSRNACKNIPASSVSQSDGNTHGACHREVADGAILVDGVEMREASHSQRRSERFHCVVRHELAALMYWLSGTSLNLSPLAMGTGQQSSVGFLCVLTSNDSECGTAGWANRDSVTVTTAMSLDTDLDSTIAASEPRRQH